MLSEITILAGKVENLRIGFLSSKTSVVNSAKTLLKYKYNQAMAKNSDQNLDSLVDNKVAIVGNTK